MTTSTPVTPRPRDSHSGLGVAATDAASLIAEHPDAPSLCSLVIEHTHLGPRVLAQLSIAPRRELANLVAYAELLGETLVHLRRYVTPDPFTYAAVHSERRESHVRVWTHPDDDELAALWAQRSTNEPPEAGVDVVLGLDAVRAAAERAAGGGG